MHVIYKATNTITGDRYVGKDINWPNRRSAHLWLARRGGGFYFHNAIRRYGEDKFIWEIIDVVSDKTVLAEREMVIIKELSPEYNLTTGGEGRSAPHSSVTKKKISEALIGNKNSAGNKNALGYRHTNDALKKISAANKGKNLSDEHRAKISETRKTNKNFSGGINSWPVEKLSANARRVGSMPWWNNGIVNKRSQTQPGNEWVSGRVKKN